MMLKMMKGNSSAEINGSTVVMMYSLRPSAVLTSLNRKAATSTARASIIDLKPSTILSKVALADSFFRAMKVTIIPARVTKMPIRKSRSNHQVKKAREAMGSRKDQWRRPRR
nr:hypothetical protein [Halomonas faecis]